MKPTGDVNPIDHDMRTLLEAVRSGDVAIDDALQAVHGAAVAELGFARVDHARAARCGFPEVILCEGKTAEQVEAIAREITSRGAPLLATRVDPATATHLLEVIPGACHDPVSRTVTARAGRPPKRVGQVAIVAAGTSDIPVAEEARVTAEMLDARVDPLYDVGVAGLHRLARHVDRLRSARALVVVAGMEGALPSVIGGLVDRPVIAVPTSVGYGASFGGLAALLGMLNSCAAGVLVVNIDNGFGAGYAAALINRNR